MSNVNSLNIINYTLTKITKKLSFPKDSTKYVIHCQRIVRNMWYINKYLRHVILQFYSNDVAREKTLRKEDEYLLTIHDNNNTMKSEIKCAYRVNFTKPHNIGSLLAFSSNRVLKPQQWHESNVSINIINVNSHWMQCYHGRIQQWYVRSYDTFSRSMSPGYKISERSTQIIYLPIIVWSVTDLTIRVVDQDGQLLDFRGEEIIRLHVRRRQR